MQNRAAVSRLITMNSPRSIAALLGTPVRVTLPDQRQVEGSLMCIDKQGNLVLAGCVSEGVEVGTVTVARSNIVAFESKAPAS